MEATWYFDFISPFAWLQWAKIKRLSARAGKGHGIASVGGETACEVDLLFVIVDG